MSTRPSFHYDFFLFWEKVEWLIGSISSIYLAMIKDLNDLYQNVIKVKNWEIALFYLFKNFIQLHWVHFLFSLLKKREHRMIFINEKITYYLAFFHCFYMMGEIVSQISFHHWSLFFIMKKWKKNLTSGFKKIKTDQATFSWIFYNERN